MAIYMNKETKNIVEAIQWTDNTTLVKNFVGEKCYYNVCDTAWEVGKGIPHETMYVYTKEEKVEAFRKDFFIRNLSDGEYSVCRPDSFEETYELVVA